SINNDVELFHKYKSLGIAVVFIDNIPQSNDSFDVVTINNEKASYELVQHLVDNGHRDIAIITGPLEQSSGSERLDGFKKCLKDNKISINKEWIGIGDFK